MGYVIQNTLGRFYKAKMTLKVFFSFNAEISIIINFLIKNLRLLTVIYTDNIIKRLNINFISFYLGAIVFIFKTKKNRNKLVNSNIFNFLNFKPINSTNKYIYINIKISFYVFRKNFIFSYIYFFNFFIILTRLIHFNSTKKLIFSINLLLISSITFNNVSYKLLNY